nr:uncharacterized protein LOC111512140 [Leptinotarsa decemlineata]
MAVSEYKGHLREFDPSVADWSIFKRRIENYFVANNINDDKRKGAILLNVLSEDAYKLIHNSCMPAEPDTKKYSELIPLLEEHFKPSLSVFAARYKFYHSQKLISESPREWSARLRNLATLCDFENDQLELVLRDKFIMGYDKGPVQDRLFEEKNTATFKSVTEVAIAKATAHPSLNSGNFEPVIKKESDIHYA